MTDSTMTAASPFAGNPNRSTVPERAGPTPGRYATVALATSLINLGLHAAAHGLFLGGFYRAYPPGSEAFVRQLYRPADQLVVWAMVVTSLALGLLITTVMRWSRATTLGEALRRAAALGGLFWGGVNSGIYASSHHFSLPVVLVDTLSSALCMTVAGTFAAWALYSGRRGVDRSGA